MASSDEFIHDGNAADLKKPVSPAMRFLQVGLLPIISALALGATGISYGLASSEHTAVLSRQSNQISDLSNKIAAIEADHAAKEAASNMDASGFSQDRKLKDDDKMEAFMKVVTTWKSYDEYTQARDEVMKLGNLTAESTFMKNFMPDIPNTVDSAGKSINKIDVGGYNMTFVDLDTTVTGIKTTTYSYFGLVTVSSTNPTTGTSVQSYVPVTYDVDADGNISNIEAVQGMAKPSHVG